MNQLSANNSKNFQDSLNLDDDAAILNHFKNENYIISVDNFIQGIHCPIFLRGFIRRRKKNNSEMPYFLKEEYIKNIFPLDKLLINQYIDINKVKNPEILSRALTLEFIFQKIKENN